jgi:hypothetical protein
MDDEHLKHVLMAGNSTSEVQHTLSDIHLHSGAKPLLGEGSHPSDAADPQLPATESSGWRLEAAIDASDGKLEETKGSAVRFPKREEKLTYDEKEDAKPTRTRPSKDAEAEPAEAKAVDARGTSAFEERAELNLRKLKCAEETGVEKASSMGESSAFGRVFEQQEQIRLQAKQRQHQQHQQHQHQQQHHHHHQQHHHYHHHQTDYNNPEAPTALNRASLTCMQNCARIESYETSKHFTSSGKHEEVTRYAIDVRSGKESWVAKRRFTEFEELRKSLKAAVSCELPKIPGKGVSSWIINTIDTPLCSLLKK